MDLCTLHFNADISQDSKILKALKLIDELKETKK